MHQDKCFDPMRAAVERRHIKKETVEWIIRKLKCRNCQIKVENEASNNTKGCPKEVFYSFLYSPFLLIIRCLSKPKLDSQGYEIFIRSGTDWIRSFRNGCRLENLRINPNKIVVIPFTTRFEHSLKNPVMRGVTVEFPRKTGFRRATCLEFSN
jgi:hypothetical protein